MSSRRTPPRRRAQPRRSSAFGFAALAVGVVAAGLAIGALLTFLTAKRPAARVQQQTVVVQATPGPSDIAPVTPEPPPRLTPEPSPSDTPEPTPTPSGTPSAKTSPKRTPSPTPHPTHRPTPTPAPTATPTAAPTAAPPPTREPTPRARAASPGSGTVAAAPRADRETPVPVPPPVGAPTLPAAPPPLPEPTRTASIVADSSFATAAARAVRAYLGAIQRGDDRTAYALLGASPGDAGVSLSEKKIIDATARITSVHAHSTGPQSATVNTEISGDRGTYFATYDVEGQGGTAVIRSHEFIQP